jgi:hypothetical protein
MGCSCWARSCTDRIAEPGVAEKDFIDGITTPINTCALSHIF